MDAIKLVESFTDFRNLLGVVFYFNLGLMMVKIIRNINRTQLKHSDNHRSLQQNGLQLKTHINDLLRNGNSYQNGVTKPRRTQMGRSMSSNYSVSAPGSANKSCTQAVSANFNACHAILFSLSLSIFPFLPASNIFFYVGFVVAERVLYIPSLGICLLVAVGVEMLLVLMKSRNSRDCLGRNQFSYQNGNFCGGVAVGCRWNGEMNRGRCCNGVKCGGSCGGVNNSGGTRLSNGKESTSKGEYIVYIMYSLLVVVYSIRTYDRNNDWLNEEALYKAGVKINPAKALGNLANVLNKAGKVVAAEKAYKTALFHRPNMADIHYNLGLLYQEQGRLAESVESYKVALQCRPKLTMAYLNLGITLAVLGRQNEAEKAYRQCSEVDISGLKDPRLHEHTRISALYNLGRLLADQDKHQDAIETYMRAVERKPASYPAQSLYNMIGESYSKLGHLTEAESYYKKSLSSKNDHVPAHLTLAKLYHKKGLLSEAEFLYQKALTIDPLSYDTYHHYGQFLSELDRWQESVSFHLEAAKLASNNFEVAFNTANALRTVGRNLEAELHYKRAVQIQPDISLAHMNLGAMLHFNGKLLDAERSYLRALELKPGDVVTIKNLKKLRLLIKNRKVEI